MEILIIFLINGVKIGIYISLLLPFIIIGVTSLWIKDKDTMLARGYRKSAILLGILLCGHFIIRSSSLSYYCELCESNGFNRFVVGYAILTFVITILLAIKASKQHVIST